MPEPTIRDVDIERLIRADKLFEEEKIDPILTRLTPNQILFFAMWKASHNVLNEDSNYFYDEFPHQFMLLTINENGLSRQEALTLFKQRPQYQLNTSEEEDSKVKEERSLLSYILGK